MSYFVLAAEPKRGGPSFVLTVTRTLGKAKKAARKDDDLRCRGYGFPDRALDWKASSGWNSFKPEWLTSASPTNPAIGYYTITQVSKKK